ncbi:MAG: LytTR family DNA-binding domain-containing protein [Eubacteriales bacterium]|nr:LytTR family DNA-binding domain-containing protein [Eubacteriales bacterium]
MVRILILDDDKFYLEKAKKLTEDYFTKKGIPCRVDTYQSAEWVIAGLKEEFYDLYILDVEMEGKNGIEVAKEIRRLYPEPVIIFITNYVDYAVEAYEVNTYRYIPKEVMDKKLVAAYETIIPSILEKEEQYYIIEKKGEVEKIAYSDIFYIKKEGKYVVFVHKRGESKVRKPLTTVLQELTSKEFVLIDKGYAANIRHIMKMKSRELYMRDGIILAVGETRFGSVKKAILDFWT